MPWRIWLAICWSVGLQAAPHRQAEPSAILSWNLYLPQPVHVAHVRTEGLLVLLWLLRLPSDGGWESARELPEPWLIPCAVAGVDHG